MSSGEQEQQTLEAIGEDLARSAPKLTSMLSIFSRLTAGETMPAREPARYPGPGAAATRRPAGGHLVRGARRWVWLVAVLALIRYGIRGDLTRGFAAVPQGQGGQTQPDRDHHPPSQPAGQLPEEQQRRDQHQPL